MNEEATGMPWVLVYLNDKPYAISSNYVREMVVMPDITAIPEVPPFLRGVINLRGKVLPVIDLRIRMGKKSLAQESSELIELLEAREQDHKNWLTELEASVREKRPFKLATDPSQCAFGKWYDAFRTDNRVLASCLKKFDAPHRKIHSIALETKGYEQQGEYEQAFALIDQTREFELAMMIQLFNEARSLIREQNREIAIVVELGDIMFTVAVDVVATVEMLRKEDITPLSEIIPDRVVECIEGIGRRVKNNELVQLIDLASIASTSSLERFTSEPATQQEGEAR